MPKAPDPVKSLHPKQKIFDQLSTEISLCFGETERTLSIVLNQTKYIEAISDKCKYSLMAMTETPFGPCVKNTLLYKYKNSADSESL